MTVTILGDVTTQNNGTQAQANSRGTEPTVVARVYIVRHGETDHNRQGIVQGQLDTPLNEAGVEQARLAADALEDTPFEVAYSSDLQRARRVSVDVSLGLHSTRS